MLTKAAGTVAAKAFESNQERNIRSIKLCKLPEPVVIISGIANTKTSL